MSFIAAEFDKEHKKKTQQQEELQTQVQEFYDGLSTQMNNNMHTTFIKQIMHASESFWYPDSYYPFLNNTRGRKELCQ